MNYLLFALWRASWQGAWVIALVWCVCRAFERHIRAGLRCTLWRLAYAKLLFSLVVAGGVALPLLRPMPGASETYASDTVRAIAAPYAGRIAAPISADAPGVLPPPSVARGGNEMSEAREACGLRIPWQMLLITVYLAGVIVCLLRVAWAGMRTRRVLRKASPINDATCEATLTDLVVRLGLPHAPKLRVSDDITVPTYAAGTILLPASADYAPDALRLILAHELAHARRRDLVYEALGTLTQLLFFFHPLVWLARREERLARESAADALALRVTGAPAAEFGKLLLSLALEPQNLPSLAGAIGAVEGGPMLRRRLLALRSVSARLPIALTAALTFIGAAALVPVRVTHALAQRPIVSLPPPPSAEARYAANHPVGPWLQRGNMPFGPWLQRGNMPFGPCRVVGEVRDDENKPVTNVLIWVINEGDPHQMVEVRPDRNGHYAVGSLPTGRYSATLVFDDHGMNWSSADHPYTHSEYRFTLNRVAKTVIVNILASRGVTVSGRVIDPATGQPVSDVTVFGSHPDGAIEDSCYTNANGAYFLRLPVGSVSVSVVEKSIPNYKIFTLSLGQSATQDFSTSAIRVVDPDSNPVEGAQVFMSPANTYVTDAKGQILPSDPTPGSFRVTVPSSKLTASGHFRLVNGRWVTTTYDRVRKIEVPSGNAIRLVDPRFAGGNAIRLSP